MSGMADFRFYIVILLIICLNFSCAGQKSNSTPTSALPADTPENGTYFIANEWIPLENGLAEMEAAPGSASKIRIAILGKAIYSDLNYDTEKDAVIFLTYQGGGSGTFFYLTVALNENGKFSGKNSIWLGDRIGPPTAEVRNGLITVSYLDRPNGASMAAAPGLERRGEAHWVY